MPRISDRLFDLVKHAEGFRAEAYLCPAGYPTIGYGHRVASLAHPPISEHLAAEWLLADLQRAQTGALTLAPNLLSFAGALDALTDLIFNVGVGALDGADPDTPVDDAGVVQAMRRQDWTDAKARLCQWTHARDPKTHALVELPGLVTRRQTAASWIP